jgi:hypothetical protein
MNRRDFTKALVAASPALPAIRERLLARAIPAAQQSDPASQPADSDGFPAGSYTPHGYLDNPYHSWALHPSGVLRSVPPLGLGLYFPAGPGGYFDYSRNSVYRSILRIGLRIGDKVYYEDRDFPPGAITASHHSKNILTLNAEVPPLKLSTVFYQLDEQTLSCTLSLGNSASSEVAVKAFAVQRLELGASEWWGRDGIAGLYDTEGDCVLLRSFAAGPVFALSGDVRSVTQLVTANEAGIKPWMAGSALHQFTATAYYPAPLHGGLAWTFTVSAAQAATCHIFLTRAVNEGSAITGGRSVKAPATSVYEDKKSEDNRFWSHAPRLEGDFPAHWKNSWVYDFETLRTMVRNPLGVYKHPWDAMQIQAPRNVLAETSIDMWALSYADPETAKTVMLGQFEDALEHNVPCMREDGTMNMVAADGSECGTSLQWCYPFYCMESVFLRTVDRTWLAELYPSLSALLEWTLKNRTDRDGWVVAKCSWESGMDASGRFLMKQPTGGELIDFVRVAELQAAMSHAARTMERYAGLLGKSDDAGRWAQLASTYAEKTRQLWYEGWFYDVDVHSGKPIVIPGHREVTQVGPIMCGVATPEQVRAMIPPMREYESNQEFWLEWPSHVLPYAEAMWLAGEREYLSRVLYEIVDRVYRSMDRRDVEPGKKLGWPGVSCEMWGLGGARGGECYGWGATLPAHIIRSVFGFREDWGPEKWHFSLGPNLPEALWGAGKSLRLRNIYYRDRTFEVHYTYRQGQKLLVELTFSSAPPNQRLRVTNEAAREVPLQSSKTSWSFEADNHAIYHVGWAS